MYTLGKGCGRRLEASRRLARRDLVSGEARRLDILQVSSSITTLRQQMPCRRLATVRSFRLKTVKCSKASTLIILAVATFCRRCLRPPLRFTFKGSDGVHLYDNRSWNSQRKLSSWCPDFANVAIEWRSRTNGVDPYRAHQSRERLRTAAPQDPLPEALARLPNMSSGGLLQLLSNRSSVPRSCKAITTNANRAQ